jgi:4-hydroxy-tetrahydrodipicolinate synthase
MFEINGVVPMVPTPFAPDGSIDWAALEPSLNFAVDAQVCAVCLPAYASEFYKLRDGERWQLVCHAIRILNGRLPVFAQINHLATSYVVETARDLERAGASAISVAVPRLFGLLERDLLRYFDRILNAIAVPLIIQDFNPGGPTVSLEFVQSLNNQHKHFRYLKLEEPLMSARVQAIAHGTKGAVGVVGWGGMYMLELIDSGICGVMPGLAVSDILQNVWERARAGKKDAAYETFQGVLPQIVYSLQNLEFFHHGGEIFARGARGTLNAEVRDATLTINEVDRAHIDFLNRKVLELLHSRRNMRTATNLSTKVSA